MAVKGDAAGRDVNRRDVQSEMLFGCRLCLCDQQSSCSSEASVTVTISQAQARGCNICLLWQFCTPISCLYNSCTAPGDEGVISGAGKSEAGTVGVGLTWSPKAGICNDAACPGDAVHLNTPGVAWTRTRGPLPVLGSDRWGQAFLRCQLQATSA